MAQVNQHSLRIMAGIDKETSKAKANPQLALKILVFTIRSTPTRRKQNRAGNIEEAVA